MSYWLILTAVVGALLSLASYCRGRHAGETKGWHHGYVAGWLNGRRGERSERE